MGKQNTMMRVSQKNAENLKVLKNNLNLSSYDEVIAFLIESNFKGNSELNYFTEIKKTLEAGLSSNEKRIEAVHKRLGHLDKFYFTKILDTHHLLKEFLSMNLREKTLGSEAVNEDKISIESLSVDQNSKLEKEVKEVWESHREIEEINQDLISQINNLKSKFKFESGAFSKNYKAVLSIQEFEEIFK